MTIYRYYKYTRPPRTHGRCIDFSDRSAFNFSYIFYEENMQCVRVDRRADENLRVPCILYIPIYVYTSCTTANVVCNHGIWRTLHAIFENSRTEWTLIRMPWLLSRNVVTVSIRLFYIDDYLYIHVSSKWLACLDVIAVHLHPRLSLSLLHNMYNIQFFRDLFFS